ncbi:30S ribosomal protein THX [Gaetbulibacter sp. S0825]|nr:30S ribosomal protein THX [Gaetbulibacter sp. S0825]
MGKGDKKTKRGKITMGSYGVRRPRKKQKAITKAAPKVKKTAEKPKAAAKPKPATKKKAAPKKADKK